MKRSKCVAVFAVATQLLCSTELSTTARAQSQTVAPSTLGPTARESREQREKELDALGQGSRGPSTVAEVGPASITETEPNNTAGTADLVTFSGTFQPAAIVLGAIAPGNDVDFFTFTAAAGSRAWIETDTGGTQNAGATSRDTVIDLLAANGTTVIENDDDDGTGNGGNGTIETGLASMIAGRTLTAGGTYFIRVQAFSATGVVNPYRLLVTVSNTAATAEVEPNGTAATANSIVTLGSSIGLRSASVGGAGDLDYYSVVARVGTVIYFSADADPERDGTGTDLVVEFRDPSDAILLSVDSSITGSLADPAAEGANYTIPANGTYFVAVRHFSATGTGTYHLMVVATSSGLSETEPNDTAGTATPIDFVTPRVAITGATINTGGDIDFFRFTAAAGSRAWIETDTGGTQNAGATSRDTVIDLLAADGITVIENDDDDGSGNGGDGTVETGLASMIAGRTLTDGGTYFIRVQAFSATAVINPYRLLVTLTNTATTAEVEPNGTAATANPIVTSGSPIGLRSGSIGVAADVDYYSVFARAGTSVYFSADADPERDGTGTDLVVEFRDPSDTLLLSIDSSITGSLANPTAEGANYFIATDGTYLVAVRHFSATGTGTYHLMVATTIQPQSNFTDDPVGALGSIRATHVLELRARIDAIRARFGQGPFAWTNASLAGVLVSAIHVNQLRSVLQAAYASANLVAPTFTDAVVPNVTLVKALHINELRHAVIALESR